MAFLTERKEAMRLFVGMPLSAEFDSQSHGGITSVLLVYSGIIIRSRSSAVTESSGRILVSGWRRGKESMQPEHGRIDDHRIAELGELGHGSVRNRDLL